MQPPHQKIHTMKSNLITVSASSEFDACEVIYAHLEKFRSEGWTPGKINALVDGWKNQYEFIRNEERFVLEFDMRPSLPIFSNEQVFTIASMMLTQPNALHIMRSMRDGKPIDQQNYFWGYVFWVAVALIIIYIINQ
jgi:hypothetical protein